MASRLGYLLFGDQSLDTHAFLASFFRQHDRGILAKAFLDQTARGLKIEVDRLSKLEQSKLPTFRTLQQLNQRYHEQKTKHPGIDSALLCIAQLAHYIEYVTRSSHNTVDINRHSSHAEKHCEDITRHDETYLVGLCSGLFAACAIASTSSLSSLVPLAVQTVLFAFRTGSHVAALAETLCPASETSASWTYIFPDLTEDEASSAVTAFNFEKVSQS